MRLIDADALVERLETECREWEGESAYQAGLCAAAVIVAEAPTVGGWISVEERLPENYVKVLIAVTDAAGTFVAVVWREGDRWNDGEGGWPNGNVTHWMPFPEPPEVSKNG